MGLPEATVPNRRQVEQHDSAIHAAIFTLVLQINPRATWATLRRGECYSALTRWEEAAADYAQVLSPEMADETCFQTACCRLLAGDTRGYQQLCSWVRERAGTAKKPISPYMACRIGMLNPQGGIEPAQLLRWAEQAVASQPKCAWFLHALGAAHYRSGHFNQAIRRCRESLDVEPNWGGRMLNWLVLALAHQRLGHAEEARQWFRMAIQWREEQAPQVDGTFLAPPGLHPSDWVEFNVLLREAEALLKETAKQSKQLKK